MSSYFGPCSAFPSLAVVKYARLLAPLAKRVSQKLKIIMRVYTQKPRSGLGWPGPFMQSDLLSAPNANVGILYARKMLLDVIKFGVASS